MMMQEIIELAKKLPTGIRDKKALVKYEREKEELVEALRNDDTIGALLEAADCFYYLNKAVYNHLLLPDQAEVELISVIDLSAFTYDQIVNAAIAKYTLRARPGNPKDDAAERKAIKELVQLELLQ